MKAFKKMEVAMIEPARKGTERNVVTSIKVTVSEETNASTCMKERTISRKQTMINSKAPKVIVIIVNTVISSAERNT